MQIKTKQPIFLISTIVAIACFRILLAFQGFDLAEEGLALTFYQQIFNDPQSVEYSFLYWLSGIVGGIWLKLFPNAGLFSFRILAILVQISSLILMIAIFRKRLPDWILAVSCMVLTLIFDFGVIAFEHHQLTLVLGLAAFYFLIKGIERNQRWALFFSGFLLAVNVFSRLPNLTLWVWILLIPLFSMDRKKTWQQIGWICMGLVIGVLAVFLTMLALGHIDFFINSIFMTLEIADHPENPHSFVQLSHVFIRNYESIGLFGVILIGLGGVMFLLLRYFDNRKWIKFLISFTFFAIFWLWMNGKPYVFWLYAVCFLAQALLFWKTDDKNLRRLILGSILMMVLLPLGSDWGVGDMGLYSIWLAIPLTLWWGFSYIVPPPIFNQTKHWLFVSIWSVFCVLQLIDIVNQAYFDKESRFHKRYTIQHPIANYVFTTEFRAALTNQLISALNGHISPNDFVLTFEDIPMVHAITQSRPFLHSPLPAHDSATFAKQLARAEQTRSLPIVVQQHDIYTYNPGRVAAFNAFLEKYDYKTVWTNGYFSILIVE
ncbi:MAG: glycosyltransferase family 39 protein [Bacteroidales bacterium]|jgi:hypothetical protein|nr:glycosyltransferase family 39 protein [Bacteroidales bacterium]